MKNTDVSSGVSSFRAASLIAFVLAFCTVELRADIILEGRNSVASASASASRDGATTINDTQVDPPSGAQTDFLPSGLSASASAPGTNASGSGSGSSSSQIVLDAAAGTLEVTGSATANATANAAQDPPKHPRLATATGQGLVIILTFTLTDISYDYTVTGSISASRDDPDGDGAAQAILERGTFVEFNEEVRNGGTTSISRSGRLTPGTWRIIVNAFAQADDRLGNLGGGSASASVSNFVFRLRPAGTSAPIRWNNPAGGSFQVATNWDPQKVPTGTDDAVFDLPGTYTVFLEADASHSGLQFHGSGINVTLELSGESYTLSKPLQAGGLAGDNVVLTVRGGGGIVSAPLNGRGLLAITPGGDDVFSMPEIKIPTGNSIRYLNRILHLSQLATIEGSWFLDGQGTSIEATQLNVGIQSNNAKLEVVNSALLVTGNTTLAVEAPATGTVSLNSGGLWQLNGDLTVGKAGLGEMNIQGGSSLVVRGSSILAENAGSTGNLSVKGVGSRFQTETLRVGGNGLGGVRDGDLTISDAGRGVIKSLIIKAGGTSVTGQSSRLIISSSLEIGGGVLPATLIVDEGGTLNGEGSTPQLVVANAGTVLIDDGSATLGTFSINSGGEFTLASTGDAQGSTGTIKQAGNLNVNGDSTLMVRSSLQVDGTLTVATSAFVAVGNSFDSSVGAVRINPGGVLRGMGTIIAAEIAVDGSGNNQFTGGQVLPGNPPGSPLLTENSPGTLTFQGNFTQRPGGRLVMEAAGVNAGQFDVLHVTGNTTLGGTLEVLFLDGYLPRTGDSFGFLQLDGTVSGDFAEVVFPQLEPGFEIKTEMVGGTYQLTALNDAVFLPVKGIFRGVLDGDPAGHGAGGFFTIRVSARGTFSARFVLGGQSFTIRGSFDSTGKFTGSIPRAGADPLMITLQLPPDVTGVITGSIFDGVHTIPISADRASAFKPKKNPASQAGKYTAVLQFDSATSDAPQADGIGTVVVSKSGAIRFAGALPDGTRLSQGTKLSKSGEWPLFVLLYKKQGSLFGALQFRDEGGSDFDGLLHWSRPATPDHKFQTAGFFATLPAIGSRYVAPPARPAVLELPNGATATLSDAELTPALIKQVTLAPPNNFVVMNPGADQFSLRAKTANGLLVPRFVHPVTGLLTKGQGIVFQKQNFGSGFFLRPGTIGSFDLQANP